MKQPGVASWSPESRMGEQRHALLTDLVAVAERELRDHEIPAATAGLVANAIADRLVKQWGGRTIGFPKDYRWRLSARELEIYDAFNGSNWGDLARQFDITERSVRRVIDRVLLKIASFRDKRQMDLLDPSRGA